MKKYALYGILSFLSLILLIAFIFMVKYVNIKDLHISQNVKYSFDDIKREIPQTWQDKFSNLKINDYYPAANEFYMSFNMDDSAAKPKQKFYILDVNKNDVYSMFCLKQTLQAFLIKYTLIQSKNEVVIYLDTDNKQVLKNLIERLKFYDINANLKEAWL
ncbi:hypothetical protein CINS5915_04330 [Campylobacter insulaenigrae]|uniref:Periplasmic protein n=2 Tax=Campylobacter insulaenigrae TaxID=260714 RepID=A0A0A8H1U9_9BACT|nr:hypothetical protein [Campylobacter insulaenigrae]AJC88113.1 hypothetical protein CINS_1151 [Campylobacter insulaenigrae NCTC 12927]MCR6572771.1 hypothetical protein [Campylobacter insulaenigrae]MCR6573591.1 hypothetical protein [Campylobacter insulaenigrae]MCR6575591.1 hypothetical protein [Campylobacter insulaenigrae]MCR6577024.1 hypothetical protein [Campylobacter insulaenigrae]